MTSEGDAEFVERISDFIRRQFGIADGTRIRALARRGAEIENPGQDAKQSEGLSQWTCGWIAGREAAAKCADEFADKWATVWRKGLKCDSHLEGMSDGADDVAQAIRALPPPPAGETE